MALFGRGTPSRADKPGARDSSPRQFMAAAEELRRANRMRECIETLERGVHDHPGYVAAHVALGRAFQQADLVPRAILTYLDALKIDRENLVAVRQLADCYLRQGEKLEALKKLKLFRGLKPGEREVDELITQLESELMAARRAASEPRETTTGAVSLRTGPISRPTHTGSIPPLPPRSTAPRLSVETLPGVVPPPVAAPAPVASAAPREESSETLDFDSVLLSAPAPPAPAAPPAFESFFTVPPPPPEEPQPEAAAPPPMQEETSTAAVPTMDRSDVREAEPVVGESSASKPFESFFGEEVLAAPVPAAPATPAAGETGPVAVVPPEAVAGVREDEPFLPASAEAAAEAPWEAPPADAPVLSAAALEEEAAVPPETEPAATTIPGGAAPWEQLPPDAPAVPQLPDATATLAELYRSQGYLDDAAKAYESLAARSGGEAAAEEFRLRAAALSAAEGATPAGRLRAFASRLPEAPRTRIEEMSGVLESLRTRAPGLRAVVLTDLEGLPVVSAAQNGGDPESEALVAELTTFWKSVQRTEGDVGAGALRAVVLRGEAGAAVVTRVSSEYSLILHVERDVPLGRIRYEAARAAGLLRPALG